MVRTDAHQLRPVATDRYVQRVDDPAGLIRGAGQSHHSPVGGLTPAARRLPIRSAYRYLVTVVISCDITTGGAMSDVLIRDIPDDVLAALDLLAAKLGLSRTEYIRRRLAQDAHTIRTRVTTDDWRRITDTYGDLGDATVMERAWE
jgi:uncharacterized alpha-E superfamily protein